MTTSTASIAPSDPFVELQSTVHALQIARCALDSARQSPVQDADAHTVVAKLNAIENEASALLASCHAYRTEALIQTWLHVGKNNLFVSRASDPPFNRSSFTGCATPEELVQKVMLGNWSLGAAFYHRDLCFIQQEHGGSEWLVIRENVAFESFTCRWMNPNHLLSTIRRILGATPEQCARRAY
jgi:hypothetical protein